MILSAGAVLFDVDGTLVDSLGATERTWRRWAESYRLDPDHVVSICHGRRTEDTVASLLPEAEWEAAVVRLDEIEITDLDGIRAMPGAVELLAALDGVPWAIVTSCTQALVRARMTAAGLGLPEVVVTADDVVAGKPDPQGYLMAAKELGHDPSSCVVVEDVPAGVRAGRDAGASVLAVTSTHRRAELGSAHAVVDSLEAVRVVRSTGGIELHLP